MPNLLDDPFHGITPCPSHPMEMQEDCDACGAEFQTKNAVFADIQEQAAKDMRDLAQIGVRVPPDLLMNIRLEVLIESFLRDRNRVHFEVEAGRRFCQALAEAKVEAQKSTLQHPANGLQVVRNLPKGMRDKR